MYYNVFITSTQSTKYKVQSTYFPSRARYADLEWTHRLTKIIEYTCTLIHIIMRIINFKHKCTVAWGQFNTQCFIIILMARRGALAGAFSRRRVGGRVLLCLLMAVAFSLYTFATSNPMVNMCFHCSGGFFIFPDFFGNFCRHPPHPRPAHPPPYVIHSWYYRVPLMKKTIKNGAKILLSFTPLIEHTACFLQASHFWQWLYTKSAAEMLPQPLQGYIIYLPTLLTTI